MPPEQVEPTTLESLVNSMADTCAGEMQQAWTRGVCDGLEFAARTIQGVMPHLRESSAEIEITRGFIMALRSFQAQIQIEGLPG
jgi:hypothetical protein